MSCVNWMSYVSYMSNVAVGKLYELHELCRLYEYFMNHMKWLEITWIALNKNFFFHKFFKKFL